MNRFQAKHAAHKISADVERRFPKGGTDPLTYVTGNGALHGKAREGMKTGALIRKAAKQQTRAKVNAYLVKAGL